MIRTICICMNVYLFLCVQFISEGIECTDILYKNITSYKSNDC